METLFCGYAQAHRSCMLLGVPSSRTVTAAASGGPSPSSSFSPFSEEEQARLVVERKQEEVWTSEQLDIVAALLQTPPRPFSANRPAPPAPRHPSKHRSVGIPVRHARTRISQTRPAKDKRFLTRLATQISELPHGHHVSDILHAYQHVLIRGSLSATIRELGHLGQPLRALETFEWQQSCTHLCSDERTLCASIEVLAKAHMEEKAWDLLQEYAPASPLAFQALAHGLMQAGLLHRALLVKKSAENCGVLISQGMYAELILLASHLNKMKEVRTLVQELGAFPELQLTLEHCTSVMAACRKAQMYDAVLGLFYWWKHAGFLPNVVMYEIVITSLSSVGKHRDALAMYWEMEKNDCAPNLLAYTALFEVCVQLGDSLRALRLYARMRDSDIAPTYAVYKNLIKVCCSDGRLGKAKEFMGAMKKEGLWVESMDDCLICE
eukprot:c33606_g1_i1 orf=87-1400(+)